MSTTVVTRARPGNLWSGMNWMAGLSLLLFWLPVVGPMIAGVVGGWKAGDLRRALLAVFLPAVGTGILVALGIGWLTHLAFWGFLAGLGGLVLALLNVGPMLVGAIAGGIAAGFRHRVVRPAP
ncbi:MAG: hypothetical protein ACM3OH_12960 [Bacillota bacterium]|jgi:hypothetical protein